MVVFVGRACTLVPLMLAGCLACAEPSRPPEPPSQVIDVRPAAIALPPRTPNVEHAAATVAAAGYDLDAELEPFGWGRGCDGERAYADDLFTAAEQPVLESLATITHYARSPQLRRAALHRHISLRLARCDLREAVPLLEAYTIAYADEPDAVWAAIELTDALTMLWRDSPPEGSLAASERMKEWVRLAPTLSFWSAPEASELRRAIRAFEVQFWPECWSDGSFHVPGTNEQRFWAQRHYACAERYAAVAELSEAPIAASAHWNAANLYEAADEPDKARAQLERLVARFPDDELAVSAAERLRDR